MATYVRGGILKEMFSNCDTPRSQGEALEDYKAASVATIADTDARRTTVTKNKDGYLTLNKAAGAGAPNGAAEALGRLAELTKGFGADQAAAMQGELESLRSYVYGAGNVNKDWTPSNPVGGTGLTPYDLEAMAKVLVPKDTPLRNSVPRTKGQGNARKFKRIDSWTNAGIPGGAASSLPFFSSTLSANTVWGANNPAGSVPTYGLNLNRPPKISYTGSDHSVGYVELGFSDQVDYIAQFEGLGFDDLRGLSHTALLWSHLSGEERAMLYARGSGTGYEGAISAPSSITAVASGSGATITNATYYVYVTALSGPSTGGGSFESAPSTVVNTGATTNASLITVTVGTEPTGALGYNLYIGTTTGIANAHFQGSFVGNVAKVTVTPTTGGANPIAGDTSASAYAYDGYLTVQADPTISGYFARQNAAFSTSNPGSEFDTALQAMYVNNAADPDEIWMTGANRSEFGQLLRIGGTNGAASGYRTNVVTGDGDVTMGTSVAGYVNQNTGKVLDVRTHRFMPAGCALIRSTSIPIQDSHVPAPVAAVNVQDYMAIDWPDIQMSYDTSTYQVGTLVHYAPAWHGLIVGIL